MRYLLFIVLLLSGCKVMTTQEVIEADKLCKSAGYETIVWRSGWDYTIRRVDCEPKKSECE